METGRGHDRCQLCSDSRFSSTVAHRAVPTWPAWLPARGKLSETGFNATSMFLPVFEAPRLCFTLERSLHHGEEDWGPDRGGGLTQGTQKVNEKAMETTDSYLGTRSWMVTFPTLSSPPPNKHPPSFLSLISSVSLGYISLSEAARFIKSNKDFRKK